MNKKNVRVRAYRRPHRGDRVKTHRRSNPRCAKKKVKKTYQSVSQRKLVKKVETQAENIPEPRVQAVLATKKQADERVEEL